MKLAIVTDQISKKFDEAIKFGMEWEISDYEVRYLESGRVPFVSAEEIKKVQKAKEEYNLEISAISPGLFRISLKDEVQLKLQIEEHIYESFRMAERLDTRNVIIFGFNRYPREPQTNYIQVVHILGRIASLAEKYGFNLLLENCSKFWADTGENTTSILNDVNSKNLKANWDLASAARSGEIPYPYGYLAIRKHIHSIRIKDMLPRKNAESSVDELDQLRIDWEGQLRALSQGPKIHYLTIETRYQPIVENIHRNLSSLVNIFEDVESDEKYILK